MGFTSSARPAKKKCMFTQAKRTEQSTVQLNVGTMTRLSFYDLGGVITQHGKEERQ